MRVVWTVFQVLCVVFSTLMLVSSRRIGGTVR